MCVSVLILTLNEEINLPDCLETVRWSDDVVVLDSLSTDRTVEIAKAWGARVVARAFDNWAAHSNWAFENIDFKHEWVLYIDADERVPPDMREEVLRVAKEAGSNVGAYRIRFKNILFGRWIRHSSLYPSWITRLLRRGRFRYETRSVNPHPVVDGEVGHLQTHFIHHSFNKGFHHWFDKHNSYSTMEAQETIRHLREGTVDWLGLVSRDPAHRRRALKNLSFRLPSRALAKFVYMYLLRRGFLDGSAGLTYCTLQAIYEYMIVVKVREMQQRERHAST